MNTENIFGEPPAATNKNDCLRGWRRGDIAEVVSNGNVGFVDGITKKAIWVLFFSEIDGTPLGTEPFHPFELVNKSRGD